MVAMGDPQNRAMRGPMRMRAGDRVNRALRLSAIAGAQLLTAGCAGHADAPVLRC